MAVHRTLDRERLGQEEPLMFIHAISIDIASADDGFTLIIATYPDGSTAGFVTPAKETA